MKKNLKFVSLFLAVVALVFCLQTSSLAQTEDLETLRNKALLLIEQNKYVEAADLYEKIVALNPKDARAQFYLGFTLLAKAKTIKDKEVVQQMRIKARKAFLTAKELGLKDQSLDAFIAGIPEDGIVLGQFSKIPEAEDAMNEAEAAFINGKIDEALGLYQKAFKIDPTIYQAPLFTGDMYFRKNEFSKAETWYQKAIEVNPLYETAYRYLGNMLMTQQKYDLARDRYVDAYISEPFSRFAVTGINRWAQETGTMLGHPRIDVPQTTVDKNGKEKININLTSIDDGSMAWISYSATKSIWKEEKFAKTFPNEKTYRHTLQEELDALRSVVKMAKETVKDHKKLNPQIQLISKLDTEGLLEAYILLALADGGIAEDYLPYLKANRQKLKNYVLQYVIQPKK